MALIDPVVQDRDLEPSPRGRQVRAPEQRRLDGGWALRKRGTVGGDRVDARDAAYGPKPLDTGRGDDDGERVEDDAVVPTNMRAGDRTLDAPLDGALSGGELAQVARAEGSPQIEPLPLRRGSEHAAPGDRAAERRRLELDDDLGARGRGT
jgi:hypothetical protein